MKQFFFLALVLFCFSTISCQSDSAENDGRLQIAVIPKGTTHQFWKSIHAGAEKAAKEFDVNIIWQGPQKEDDRQMQIQVVQNFISRGIDGMVVAPLDSRALVGPISTAVKRKIPVVIIDSGIEGREYHSFVATDNYKGGQLAAERLSEVMGGKGKAILLRYQEGSASTTNREKGFFERLPEIAPDIELISSNQYAGATIEKGLQASQNILNRFPEVEGIFCPNETSAQAMLRALQTAGRAGDVKLIGFDSNEILVNALRDGEVHGLAIQDPFKMGYLGVKAAVELHGGGTVPRRIDTGVVMITADNMEEASSIELLFPPIDEWLD